MVCLPYWNISLYGKDQKQITAKDGFSMPLQIRFLRIQMVYLFCKRHSYNGEGGLYTIDEDGKVTDFLEKNNIQQQGIETVSEDSEGNIIFSGLDGFICF